MLRNSVLEKGQELKVSNQVTLERCSENGGNCGWHG